MNNNILAWLIPLIITLLIAFGEIFVVKVRVDYIAKRYEKMVLDIQKLKDKQDIIFNYCCEGLDKGK